MTIDNIELIEANEAAHYLTCEKLMDLNREINNVNGSCSATCTMPLPIIPLPTTPMDLIATDYPPSILQLISFNYHRHAFAPAYTQYRKTST